MHQLLLIWEVTIWSIKIMTVFFARYTKHLLISPKFKPYLGDRDPRVRISRRCGQRLLSDPSLPSGGLSWTAIGSKFGLAENPSYRLAGILTKRLIFSRRRGQV